VNLTRRMSQRKNLQTIAEFLVVGICTVALTLTIVGISAALLGGHAAGSRDFVEYWASGHLLAHHANPYDGDAILGIERSVGYPSDLPVLIMWNPPPALLLVLPLGFVGSRAGELLWSLLLLASLFASVRMVWIMHGRPNHLLNLLGYSFAPALVCLLAGQVSLLVLLGLALFLRLHRSRPFLAGASLWLCLLKPHLFLPFGLVLLVWAIATRSYRVLGGVAAALGLSSGIVFLWDPLAWMHYGQMMRTISTVRMQQEMIPCLSIMLRWAISSKTMWLQYLPSAFGCVWALAYFRKHYDHWDWMEHGSLLMMVSVLLAPYTWLMDQAVLIPALLHGAYHTHSRNLLAILALASAVIDIGALRGLALLHSPFYIWTAPAWLAWYLFATKASYATRVYEPPVLASGGLVGTAKD
jgi:Glycosyltransferase family 87